MISTRALIFVLILLTAGCTTGAKAHWWSPGTWFSHSEATAVDRTAQQQDTAREEALARAQHAAYAVEAALAAAPASRPVEVASQFNEQAVALLDQALGAIKLEDLAKLRATVRGLLSENAAIRAAAEQDRATDAAEAAKISARLAATQAAHQAALKSLRAGFERENELANEYRNIEAVVWWFVGALIVVGALGAYARLQLGGVGAALGAAGMPAAVVSQIERKTSALGQWFMRTGRVAAAKTQAVLAAKLEPTPPAP